MSASFEDQMRAFTDKAREQMEKAKALDGSHPIADVYSPEFMQRHTEYASLDVMLEAASVSVAEAFSTPARADWEAHVKAHTKFASWAAMREAANDAFLKRRLADS